MSVFAPGLANLWKTIESYGIDPAPLFEAEGLGIQLPIDPDLRISYEKIANIRAKAVEMCGDEAFGLRAASCYLPPQLGALGYAWLASRTLRAACMRMERYIRVMSDDAVARVEDRDDCLVVTLILGAPDKSRIVSDDGALALVTRMSRAIYGDKFRLQAVNFKHPEPQDLKPYFEYFGCSLNFNQPENQLMIPLLIVDEILSGANSELALLNDNVITHHLARMHHDDVVARTQAVMIDQLPLGGITDDSVADALHMSVRTLRRKLEVEGTSFRVLLSELRRKLADQYIRNNNLNLTEISMLLGFSESSAFSRAFKNWTGSSPTEVRQSSVM